MTRAKHPRVMLCLSPAEARTMLTVVRDVVATGDYCGDAVKFRMRLARIQQEILSSLKAINAARLEEPPR